MKKNLIFSLLSLCFFSSEAQNFGVNFDIGSGRPTGIYTPFNIQPKIYLGFGVFYNRSFSNSKWEIKTSLDIAKRTTGGIYEENLTDSVYGDVFYEYKYTYAAFPLTLTILPAFNVSSKIKLYGGPQISYILFDRVKLKERIYDSSEKEEELELIYTSMFNAFEYGSRLTYGFKIGVDFKLSDQLSIALNYQYAQMFEYEDSNYEPIFNSVYFSINYSFKSKD